VTQLVLPYPWEPGEHMAVIGDTGSGKSTLMGGLDGEPGLLDYRKWVTILRSKGDDVVYNAKRVMTAMPSLGDPKLMHIELFPKRGRELREFEIALDTVFKQKGWTLYVDELYHADRLLSLRPKIEDFLTRGRSLGLTMVVGLQRPVSVSRFAISQSKHVIVFSQEGRDAKTIGDATTPRIVPVIEQLARYQFVWFERATKRLWVGTLQDLWG
jgi:hypothetical protein